MTRDEEINHHQTPPLSRSAFHGGWAIAAACLVILTIGWQRFMQSEIHMLALSITDDSFYYIVPAFQLKTKHIFTFDGYNPAYGFQPLYMLALAALAFLFNNLHGFLRGALFFNASLFCATGWIAYHIAREHFDRAETRVKESAGLCAFLLFMLNVPAFLAFTTAKENALACLILAALILLSQRALMRGQPQAFTSAAIGLLSAGLILCRILPSSFLLVFFLSIYLIRKKALDLRAALPAFALPLAAWFSYAYFAFGRLLPTSGSVKAAIYSWENVTKNIVHLPGTLALIFGYLDQSIRFALGLPTPFHYILQREGWLDHGAPATVGPHFILLCLTAGVGVLALVFNVIAFIRRRERPRVGLLVTLLSASALGALFTPLLIKSEAYYFTWYLFDFPLLVPITLAFFAGEAMRFAAPGISRIEERRGRVLSWIAASLAAVFAIATYTPFTPYTELKLDLNQWSHKIAAAAIAVHDELRLSRAAKIGSYNAGLLGFFLPGQVVNLDGLANDAAYNAVKEKRSILDYARGACLHYYIDVDIDGMLSPGGLRHEVLKEIPFDERGGLKIARVDSFELLYEGYVLTIYEKNYHFVSSLGSFDAGGDGWTYEGGAMANQPKRGADGPQLPVSGWLGEGLINTYDAIAGDDPHGAARSPEFTAEKGQRLLFLIGGGGSAETGVRLMDESGVIQTWNGDYQEHLSPVLFDLTPYSGRSLRLEIFDDASGSWGHILADQFMLLRPASHE
ncbi:MAG: hypothetical protein GC154_05340 [bacterium]|nr:hypothetical protein [bacterium]